MVRHGGPIIPAMQGSTNRRITIQSDQAIKLDPLSKITNTKGLTHGSSGRSTYITNVRP
jgi:hypothetical protein